MVRYQLRREPPNSGAYMSPSDDGYWVMYGTVKHIESENAELRAKVAELTKALADEGREVKP
jgi:hypothetical protein